MSLYVFGHAHSGVADFQLHARTRLYLRMPLHIALVKFDIIRLDEQRSTARHRIPGVDRQIQDDLPQLAGVRENIPRRGRWNELQPDILADHSRQYLPDVGNYLVEAHFGCLSHPATAQEQQLTCQVCSVFTGFADLAKTLVDRIVVT
jgi:hypothetical protein